MKEDNIYKELDHIDGFKIFDVNQEWSTFSDKIKAAASASTDSTSLSSKDIQSHKLRRLPLRILSIAAGFAVLIGCFFFLNQNDQLEEDVRIVEAPIIEVQPEVIPVPPSEKDHIEKEQAVIVEAKPINDFKHYHANDEVNLPDGSTIKVLAPSSIKIPESFVGLPERYVELRSGDVEFAIVSNENQPFRALTDNSGIFVTGTTFKLLKSGIETVVKTISGSVEMYSLKDESIKTVINAGEEFRFNGETITKVSIEVEKPMEVEKPVKVEKPIEVEKPVKVEKPLKFDNPVKIEKPIAEIPTSDYQLSNIVEIVKKNFKNQLVFKKKAINKSMSSETINLPKSSLNTGNPSATIEIIVKALEDQFEVDIIKIDNCESCYEVNSVKLKD